MEQKAGKDWFNVVLACMSQSDHEALLVSSEEAVVLAVHKI